MSHSYGSRRTGDSADTSGNVDTRNDRPTVERREPYSERATTPDHRTVVARQRDEHGGVKIGSAFFGWLTAMGMTVLLTALAVGAGTALAVSTNTDVSGASAKTVGWTGAILVLAILLISYFCGGYVAGRMARFNGIKQGVAVWLWALIVAVAAAILVAVAGTDYNVFARLDAFPRIPVDEGDLTTAGIIALLVAVAVALVGAMLGGLAGMHYHRRIDRTGLRPDEDTRDDARYDDRHARRDTNGSGQRADQYANESR
jgi:amino acid transporter